MSGISSATSMLIAGGTSSALSGVGKVISGQQQKSAYDYNADITTQNTNNEVVANQQKFSERVGKQANSYAGAGVDITSGSPLLIMAATAARGGQQGEQIEQAGTEEANMQRYYGKVAAFSGTMSGIGSFLQGMTTDLSAYGKLTSNPTPTAAPPQNPPIPLGDGTENFKKFWNSKGKDEDEDDYDAGIIYR